jgi:hypothetical protein
MTSVKRTRLLPGLFLFGLVVIAGCGGNGTSTVSSPTTAHGNGTKPEAKAEAEVTAEAEAPSEAESAATGDIPDNQVFLTFVNRPAGYSIRYPEGWARRGAGPDVTFQEKANSIHLVVTQGSAPTPTSVTGELERLKHSDPTIMIGQPERVSIGGAPVIKCTYTRLSAPDPVTGKRLPLTIDRYVYAHSGKVAVLDLATPVGVDNVDAYRMISQSFRWL